MRAVVAAAVVTLGACSAPAAREPAPATPGQGMSIAIYSSSDRSYGVVDDRRMVDVIDGTILLDRIDPAAELQALVIEGLGEPLDVISCVRERVDDSAAALAQLAEARGERPRRVIVVHETHDDSTDPQRFHFENTGGMEPAILPGPAVLSPLVRCRVRARAGKHPVRVLQVSPNLTFHAQHEITMTSAERVSITTRYAIATPTWHIRATVTLHDGLPGGEAPPRALATEPVNLDGSTAIIATAPRDISARLRTVYDGVRIDPGDDVKPSDIVWGRESRHQVWLWLEIADGGALRLATGRVRAHVELPGSPARDVEIGVDMRADTSEHSRFPLWIDEDLLGTRRRSIDRADGLMITDRLQLTVSNLGSAPREVWVEERLRTARRRSISQAWPTRPQLAKDVARTKLVIAPGKTERLGFTIDYEF